MPHICQPLLLVSPLVKFATVASTLQYQVRYSILRESLCLGEERKLSVLDLDKTFEFSSLNHLPNPLNNFVGAQTLPCA